MDDQTSCKIYGFFPSSGATTIHSSISQADGISETKVVSTDRVVNSGKGSSSVFSPNDDSLIALL